MGVGATGLGTTGDGVDDGVVGAGEGGVLAASLVGAGAVLAVGVPGPAVLVGTSDEADPEQAARTRTSEVATASRRRGDMAGNMARGYGDRGVPRPTGSVPVDLAGMYRWRGNNPRARTGRGRMSL